ncbi:hypothetical protein H4R26_005042 [Coemansia thaxteri]|uniref:Uncharacterized protein n=1 Tax=Coemansia thaxteri TaxID=2663907 RepID=A0A9W8BFV9_9FUNG|nr:hypothetical protein H4R26_005042 [Coemansia thaxteri]
MFELAEMAWLAPYVQFMFTWRGRGIFYVFMGCLTLGYRALGWVFGSIIIAVGIVFLVLSFTVKRHESYVSGAGPGHGGSETMYADSSRVNKGMPAPGMYGSAAGMDPYAMQGQQPSAQHAHTQISQTQYTSGQFGNAPTRDYLHSAV